MNGGIKLIALGCILCYAALRWMVRQVLYKKEHDRPFYFCHAYVIHAVAWLAWLFLGAAFFLVLYTPRWWLAFPLAAGLVGCDLFLRWFFLNLEARRLCQQQPGLTLDRAKRRLRERVKREE